MSLIRRCPVENPCEASTFEEAFEKNAIRYAFERDESTSLYADMKRDNDPHAESVNPEFWKGCVEANDVARKIWAEEKSLLRTAQRLEDLRTGAFELSSALCRKGFNSALEHYVDAFRKNDPSIIVWW